MHTSGHRRAAYPVTALALAFMALPAGAQEYTMFEVQRVSPIVGSTVDVGTAMVEHNRLYHADAPYAGQVFYMATGEYSGQYQWVMGPTTFADIDDRPFDAAHNSDWANRVMSVGEVHETEYWVQVPNLSYAPSSDAGGSRPISVVRRFQVTDAQLFNKVQSELVAAFEEMGSPNPRTMYQRRFLAPDGWDWAAVTSYPNYAALDNPGDDDLQQVFERVHGSGSWATFLQEFGQAVAARDDALRELITGM